MLTIDVDCFPQQNSLAVFVTEAVNVYCAVETESSAHYLEELSYRQWRTEGGVFKPPPPEIPKILAESSIA